MQLDDVNDKNHVKWLKDGNELSLETSEQYSSQRSVERDKNFQLTLNHVTSEDAGMYDCASYSDENFKIKSARRYQLVVDGSLKIKFSLNVY